MSKVTATQADPNNPADAEGWRPTPSPSSSEPSKAKAAFLNSWGSDEPLDDDKAKPGREDDEDGDDDLEDDEDDDRDLAANDNDDEEPAPKKTAKTERKARPDHDAAPPEDDDADLDDKEDDEDDEDKADADPDEKQGRAKLARKEARLLDRARQQVAKERDTARAELAKERETWKAERDTEQAAATEAKAKYQRLVARADIDPMGVLEELGVKDFDHVGQQAFYRTKAAADPKYKQAAIQVQRERERDAEIAALKKENEERNKTAAESKQEAEQRQRVTAIIEGVAKSAPKVAKAQLTNLALKNDPDYAKALFAQAHLELWKRDGVEPEPRAVVFLAEKLQRTQLRRYGIDPRTLAKAAEQTADKSAKPNGKPANGKPAKKSAAEEELARPTKQQLLEEDWSR